MKIKVAFAINKLSIGGAENMLISQINAMDRERFDPYLIFLYPGSERNFFEKIHLSEKKIYEANFIKLFDISSFLYLYKWMKNQQFEAVITNLFDTNFILRFTAIISRIPVILNYEHNVYLDKSSWQKIVDWFLSLWTNKIIVGSPSVLNFTSKQEHVPKNKFEVIFNATKLDYQNIRNNRNEVLKKFNLPVDKKYIVTAGSLTEQKGHIFLIDAMKNLLNEGNKGISCLIFGKGSLKSELNQYINKLSLEDSVRLMGVGQMHDILAMSDIFTMPSLWEGLSIAMVEAMNAGCPVVATRVSGANELIQDGMNGLLAEPGDAKSLTEALHMILTNQDLAKKIGSGAKQKSREFDIENNIRQIESLITRELEQAKYGK